MSDSTFRLAFVFVVALSALAGCSNGGNNNNGGSAMEVPQIPEPEPEPPPEPEPQTDFTEFVIGLFASTADDTDPVQVNAVDFNDADRENPAAFDALLE